MALSTERQGPPPIKGGQREQDGYAVYAQLCAACHGPGQVPMRSPAKLGADGFRRLIRQGKEQMPPLPEAVLSAERVDALEAYLLSLPLADAPADESSGDAHAAAAAESEPLLGPGDPVCGIVLRGLVHEQRTSRRRAAVDAARRVRPERRHDQVARCPTVRRRDSRTRTFR